VTSPPPDIEYGSGFERQIKAVSLAAVALIEGVNLRIDVFLKSTLEITRRKA